MLFSSDGTTAYTTFHGSTDVSNPVGYLVGSIAFNSATGQPNRAYDTYDALSDIIRNTNDTGCPTSCMRPVGLAMLDDRLLFSSDATGEIYVLVKSVSTSTGYSKTTRVAIGVSVALVIVILILAGCIYWRWKRSRQLLGVHTSGDRGPDSLRLGAAQAPADKHDGLELASRRSWERPRSERRVSQDGLQPGRQATSSEN